MSRYVSIDEREHHLRTFSDQLYDSVYTLYLAFEIDLDNYKDDMIGPLIRSSVLNSILLLESTANCLIDSLELPSQYYKDIEKLPFNSKFEFFLNKISSSTKFDRGCKEVQCISELKSIRDFYVHPKVKKQMYSKISDNMWEVDYGATKQLQFPRQPSCWRREHAILALKTVNNFFNLYFLDWCNLSPDTVVDLLISSEKVDFEFPTGGHIDSVGGLDKAVSEWGINFAFLGKTV